MVKLFIGASVGYRWFRAFSITFRHISLLQRSGKSDFEHRLFLCLLDDTDATTTTTELLTMMIRQLDSRGLKNGDSLSSIVLATRSSMHKNLLNIYSMHTTTRTSMHTNILYYSSTSSYDILCILLLSSIISHSRV